MGLRGPPVGSPKKGGRRVGSKNKALAKREAEIRASGLTPLDYMLDLLRDPKATEENRRWAANAAAPYVHPRLATVTSNANITGRLTLEQLVAAATVKGPIEPDKDSES